MFTDDSPRSRPLRGRRREPIDPGGPPFPLSRPADHYWPGSENGEGLDTPPATSDKVDISN